MEDEAVDEVVVDEEVDEAVETEEAEVVDEEDSNLAMAGVDEVVPVVDEEVETGEAEVVDEVVDSVVHEQVAFNLLKARR
jgi:hypothetical protein